MDDLIEPRLSRRALYQGTLLLAICPAEMLTHLYTGEDIHSSVMCSLKKWLSAEECLIVACLYYVADKNEVIL